MKTQAKVSGEQFTDRFSREIHAVAALNHANIYHFYDVGPNYLVMELVECPTLAERIKLGIWICGRNTHLAPRANFVS